MKKTMMYLPEELHLYLSQEAGDRGVSMAHLVREAVSEYRARHDAAAERAVEAIFGVVRDDAEETDLALKTDEVLAEHYAEGGAWERRKGLADPR